MKKRSRHIHVVLGEDIKIEWDDKEQEWLIKNKDGHLASKVAVSIGDSYERIGKQPKIIRQYKNPTGSKIPLIPKINYEHYLIVDTNYMKFGENLICSVAITVIEEIIYSVSKQKEYSLKVNSISPFIFFTKDNFKPERYGWMLAIQSITNCKKYDNWVWAVIVDSDLDKLSNINDRKESIADNFYCPENMTFNYASADVGKSDSVLNKLMGATDTIAKNGLTAALQIVNSSESYRKYYTEELKANFEGVLQINDKTNGEYITSVLKTLSSKTHKTYLL